MPRRHQRSIDIGAAANVRLYGTLSLPQGALGVVAFAHGSGSSHLSPRNVFVANALHGRGMMKQIAAVASFSRSTAAASPTQIFVAQQQGLIYSRCELALALAPVPLSSPWAMRPIGVAMTHSFV
jgi:hypothetical protein